MADDRTVNSREALARRKAQLLKEAATKTAEAAKAAAEAEALDRDMADLDRLTAKYNLVVASPPVESSVQRRKQKKESEGTIAALVERYRTSDRSSYRTLRFSTRAHYDTVIKQLLDTCGPRKVGDLKAQDVQDFYNSWTEAGTKKLAMGHGLITMLRILANFGATALEDDACERLSLVLHRMKFSTAKPRTERLTPQHVMAIIQKAHEMGLHSIALAQAIQAELALRQKDVVGEWVPLGEPGVSDIVYDGEKWLRGLRWEEIDATLTLRHPASRGGEIIERSLHSAILVSQELDRLGEMPRRGPIIVSERTGRPWITTEFRRYWRMIANAAGVPKTVKNRDSYAGTSDNDGAEKHRPAGAETSTRA